METKQKIIMVVLVLLIAAGVVWKFLKTHEAQAPSRAEEPVAQAPQPKASEEPKPYQGVAQPVLKVDAAEKQKVLKAQSIFAHPQGAPESKN